MALITRKNTDSTDNYKQAILLAIPWACTCSIHICLVPTVAVQLSSSASSQGQFEKKGSRSRRGIGWLRWDQTDAASILG